MVSFIECLLSLSIMHQSVYAQWQWYRFFVKGCTVMANYLANLPKIDYFKNIFDFRCMYWSNGISLRILL